MECNTFVLWEQFKLFISFFIGVFVGCFLFSLIYIYFLFKNFNKNIRLKSTKNNKLNLEQVKDLIKKNQQQFRLDIKKNNNEYFDSLLRNSKNLAFEIATSFYPKSSFPYLELNINEVLILIQYIHDRLVELFDKKIICIFKLMTLRKILILKQKVLNAKNIKKFKKTNKFINFFSNTVNILNPFHWAKKLFLNQIYEVIFYKIGCAFILIVGEEVYKVYSKQIFNTNQDLDDFLQEIQQEIEKTKTK
ncbi:MAG: hypothetical protein Q8888_01745 [Vigna little leaf phytoplasma]|nr:hypothetical protein [Vigna little leaf phytoplasma]